MTASRHSVNAMTFDVEDYYHVEAFQAVIKREDWDGYESRVYSSTRKILEILERYGIKATFFILGWVAERTPGIVKEIQERTGAGKGEVAVGEAWETRTPTSLLYVRSSDQLPKWKRDDPDEWKWSPEN